MTDHTLKKTIPFDADAERVLLGWMLVDESLALELRGRLSPEDFYDGAHQVIASAIFDVAEAGEVSLLAVKNRLEARGQLASIGHGTDSRAGQDYLAALLDETRQLSSASNYEYYLRRLRNTGALRKLISLGVEIAADAKGSCADDVGELLARYQQRLFSLDVGAAQHSDLIELGPAVDAAVAHADAVRDGKVAPGLATGFSAIDNVTGGMQPGDLWVVGGPTSVGKTSFCLAVAAHVAKVGGSVLYLSLEMDRRAIANRLLSSESGIPGLSLRVGSLTKVQEESRAVAVDELRNWRLAIQDGAFGVAEVGVRVRQLAARWRRPLDLVCVDYLQLMSAKKSDTRAQQVSGLVRGLKGLAMQMGVPFLAISQLNREGVKTGAPPSLYSLRESGDLENISNTTLLLHRPDPPVLDTGGALVLWCQVAKNRDGPVTVWPKAEGQGIRFRFRWECARVEPLTL